MRPAATRSRDTPIHPKPPSANRRFKKIMTTGIILVAPIWMTLVLVRLAFTSTRDTSLWFVEHLVRKTWAAKVLEVAGVSAQAVHTSGMDALPPAWK